MIKYLLNRAEIIHVDAAHMKDKCIDISERAKEKIKIIQYGTDLKKFRKIKVVENNDFTIVSIRNHESIYNIDKIIAIFEKIYKTENSNVRLEILGGGQNTPALQSQTNTLSSFSKINFSGFVTQEEMINKINEGNVVISASDRDGGISVSIAEAMACEKVVIASNGPNDENDQWIDHGENGFLFNLENFDELEKLLKECIKNKNSLADIGLKARESIEKNYNFEAEMDKFDKIYKDLVNN